MTNDLNELPWTEYAESGYQAYAASKGNTTYDNKPMPAWADLPVDVQTAWEASVRQTASNLAGGNQVVDPSYWVGWQRPQDRVTEAPAPTEEAAA